MLEMMLVSFYCLLLWCLICYIFLSVGKLREIIGCFILPYRQKISRYGMQLLARYPALVHFMMRYNTELKVFLKIFSYIKYYRYYNIIMLVLGLLLPQIQGFFIFFFVIGVFFFFASESQALEEGERPSLDNDMLKHLMSFDDPSEDVNGTCQLFLHDLEKTIPITYNFLRPELADLNLWEKGWMVERKIQILPEYVSAYSLVVKEAQGQYFSFWNSVHAVNPEHLVIFQSDFAPELHKVFNLEQPWMKSFCDSILTQARASIKNGESLEDAVNSLLDKEWPAFSWELSSLVYCSVRDIDQVNFFTKEAWDQLPREHDEYLDFRAWFKSNYFINSEALACFIVESSKN